MGKALSLKQKHRAEWVHIACAYKHGMMLDPITGPRDQHLSASARVTRGQTPGFRDSAGTPWARGRRALNLEGVACHKRNS